MDFTYYQDIFQKAADKLDKKLLNNKQIEVAAGVVLDSVFLKLYKKAWATPSQDPLTAESRIFFSVWVNDAAIGEQKILYNIHALKLRKLKGYSIQSRKFADVFRDRFKDVAHKWENVNVDFGPLTLMEGWIKMNTENLQNDVLNLASNFLAIEHLVDDTLAQFR